MATSILQSVSRYVYGEAKKARTRDEHEDFSITLQLLELLQDGWSARPNIFDVACGFAVGLSHARYLYKKTERAALMEREFLSITPDYDYSKQKLPDRDPADGRRHYGNQFRRLATERDARDESRPTSSTHEDDAPADFGLGDFPNANGRYPVPTRTRAKGFAALPVADRRGSRKRRISSPAQARIEKLSRDANRAAADQKTYFGA